MVRPVRGGTGTGGSHHSPTLTSTEAHSESTQGTVSLSFYHNCWFQLAIAKLIRELLMTPHFSYSNLVPVCPKPRISVEMEHITMED